MSNNKEWKRDLFAINTKGTPYDIGDEIEFRIWESKDGDTNLSIDGETLDANGIKAVGEVADVKDDVDELKTKVGDLEDITGGYDTPLLPVYEVADLINFNRSSDFGKEACEALILCLKARKEGHPEAVLDKTYADYLSRFFVHLVVVNDETLEECTLTSNLFGNIEIEYNEDNDFFAYIQYKFYDHPDLTAEYSFGIEYDTESEAGGYQVIFGEIIPTHGWHLDTERSCSWVLSDTAEDPILEVSEPSVTHTIHGNNPTAFQGMLDYLNNLALALDEGDWSEAENRVYELVDVKAEDLLQTLNDLDPEAVEILFHGYDYTTDKRDISKSILKSNFTGVILGSHVLNNNEVEYHYYNGSLNLCNEKGTLVDSETGGSYSVFYFNSNEDVKGARGHQEGIISGQLIFEPRGKR